MHMASHKVPCTSSGSIIIIVVNNINGSIMTVISTAGRWEFSITITHTTTHPGANAARTTVTSQDNKGTLSLIVTPRLLIFQFFV
jgi:hypothetical protein